MGQETIFDTISSIYHAVPNSVVLGAITGFLSVFFFLGAFAPSLVPASFSFSGINELVLRRIKLMSKKERV